MRPASLLTIILILYITRLSAQSGPYFDLSGTVADSSGQALIGAMAVVLQATDSTLVSFAASGDEGRFLMKKISAGNYLLQVSHLGFQTHYQPLRLSDVLPSYTDLGKIQLAPAVSKLGEVLVAEERIPVRINKDTIEFDANSFQTQPNAPVEDLLKKLPGVQVEKDGTVRAQGEEVRRVTVDGKEFFGNDPKIATKNLPADAVDKVQVFDKKSDQAEFTGIDDGRREKTINLELKEDRKKGYFGSAMAGGGSDDRFQGKASINRFSEQQQLSFLGMANNVNEQGFSFEDYLNFMGGVQGMMGGGGSMRIQLDSRNTPIPIDFGENEGFTTTWAGGLNFNREWSDKTELSGSYFFSRLDREYERESKRQTFLSDRTIDSDRLSRQNDLRKNHRLNLRLDHRFDSLQSIRLTSRLGFTGSESGLQDNSRSTLRNGVPENEGERHYQAEGENKSLETDLLYRRKFNRKGRTFSANLSFGLNASDQTGALENINRFFSEDGKLSTVDTILQNNLQDNQGARYGLRLSYTEPLNKRSYFELNYGLSRNGSNALQEVYDLPAGSENEPILNPELSNDYESGYTYQRGGLNYRLNKKYYNLTAGLSLQHSDLNGLIPSRDVEIDQSFLNLLPAIYWNYEFSTSNNLRLAYETSVREPSVRELQPIVDNSDPLNIYEGNPDLQPEYVHALNARYFLFDQFSFTSLFASAEYGYTKNKIAYAQSIDEDFVRSYQPVNTDNEQSMGSYLSFGTPIRKIGMQVNIGSRFDYVKGRNFINQVENITQQTRISGDIRLENRKKDKIDFALGLDVSYNQTRYSIDDKLDQDYLSQEYFADFSWDLPLDFVLSNSFTYTLYSGLGEGFDQSIPIWNASLSKYFLKDKRLELKVAVRDLLNKNVGIYRTAELNYLEDVRSRSLARYFMLSATYSLKGTGNEGSPGIKIIQRR